MRHTDAAFNLGAAVIAARTLPPGIYIVMNGEIFTPGTVAKDRTHGRFHATDPAGHAIESESR